MASIFEFNGYKPVIDESSYVHPNATVIGNVIIGRQVYVGPGAVLRGDIGQIIIEDGCNVQENCVVHMFPGEVVLLRENAHIGHGAIIHGAVIGRNCLIGMSAVIMDKVIIGDECIVGAMAFVQAETETPARSVIVGNPARVVKAVSEDMLAWKNEGTKVYQQLPAECHATMKPCEPLRSVPTDLKVQSAHYKTWTETKKPN